MTVLVKCSSRHDCNLLKPNRIWPRRVNVFISSCFQFKEISFAYEVLTNPEKKELYDRYGEQGLREGGGGGPGMDDIFSHIFGGGLFGFMGGHGRSRNGGRRRGEDMVHPLKWVFAVVVNRTCHNQWCYKTVLLRVCNILMNLLFFFSLSLGYRLKICIMGKRPNYNWARTSCVALVMGKWDLFSSSCS